MIYGARYESTEGEGHNDGGGGDRQLDPMLAHVCVMLFVQFVVFQHRLRFELLQKCFLVKIHVRQRWSSLVPIIVLFEATIQFPVDGFMKSWQTHAILLSLSISLASDRIPC